MRFRQFAKAGEGPVSGAREAQIMIGHPNNSGLQNGPGHAALYSGLLRQRIAGLARTTAWCWRWTAEFPISEDPNIRFTYVPNGAKRFRVEAKDTEGHVFQERMEGRGLRHLTRGPLPEESTRGAGSETPSLRLRPGRVADRSEHYWPVRTSEIGHRGFPAPETCSARFRP